jgi:RNase P/RNase MRP subunit POP5
MRITLRALVPSLLACVASAADTSYLVPAQGGVVIRPIATAGDAYPSTAPVAGGAAAAGKQALPGLPDGLGAWLNGTDLHLISNHEFTSADGIVRTHGAKGAFLTQLTLDTTSNLAVTDIKDVIHTVYRATRTAGAPTFAIDPAYAFSRFCSADLPAETAVYNAGSSKGVPAATARLFFNGEEVNGKSPLLHVVDGTFAGQSVELPALGQFNYENLLACPKAQDKTIIIGQDDNSVTNSFVTVWVGNKSVLPGSPANVLDYAAAAGLTSGKLHVLKAGSAATEDVNTLVGAAKGTAIPFTLAELGTAGDVTTTAWAYASPADPQRTDAATKGTKFFRPEDGCWDPATEGVYYFVTTHQNDDFKDGLNGQTTNAALPAAGTAAVPQVGRSRLWKLVFSDITNPTAGGTITCLIDGTENPGPQMMDNLSVDHHGRIMICEDPGGSADFAARLWIYDTTTGFLKVVAKHDPANNGDIGRGAPTLAGTKIAPSAPFNRDEESSGVIDAEALLGVGHWLIDTQNHSTTGRSTEVFEGGQYMDIYVPTSFPTGGTLQSGRLATVTTASGDVAVRDSGYGSGMAFVPGKSDEIYLLTDRGPNVAGASNSILFPLPSFTPRIGKFKLNGDGTMEMLGVISLKRANGTPLTGLPLPAGATGSTGEVAYGLKADGTADTTLLTDSEGIDSEGLVAHPDGTFWISDEYGPFVLHVAADGTTIERIAPGTANSLGHKLPAVLAKRIINKGMEGLTLTPDGTKLVGIMQSALGNGIPAPAAGASADDEAKKDSCLRIMVYTIATGAVSEYVYLLEDMVGGSKKGGSVSEIVAISNTQFLVDERDGKFLNDSGSKIKSVFKIDLTGATDIHDAADSASGKLFGGQTPEVIAYNITQAAAATALGTAGITPVSKTLAVDLRTGSYPAQYNHDKIEGMALRGSTLWISNDDDFGVTDNGGLTSKDVLKSTTGSNLAGTQTRGMADFSQVISIDLSGAGVAATNSAPWMSTVAAQSLNVGTNGVVTVNVGDAETAASALTFAASSSATGVATVAVSGSGASRTLTITPVALGTATVTLTVNDGTTTTTQTVSVSVVNAAPTMSTVAGQSLTVGTAVTVNVTVGDVETAAAALTFAGSSSVTGVFTVLVGGSGATRTVTLTPVAAGAGTLTLTVNDGTTTTTQTVAVTVAAAPVTPGTSSSSNDDNKCGVGSSTALVTGLASLMSLFLLRRRR